MLGFVYLCGYSVSMKQNDAERLLKHFVEEDSVLRAYVYAATRNYTDSDDVLQDVWRTLMVKLDQYDDSRPFRGWALGVARMQIRKWRQEKGRSRETAASDIMDLLATTAEEHADEIDIRLSFLGECMQRLTESCRKMMEMKYLHNIKITDIAAHVGRNVGAVEMTLVRARRLLRECMDLRMKEAFEAVQQ